MQKYIFFLNSEIDEVLKSSTSFHFYVITS